MIENFIPKTCLILLPSTSLVQPDYFKKGSGNHHVIFEASRLAVLIGPDQCAEASCATQ